MQKPEEKFWELAAIWSWSWSPNRILIDNKDHGGEKGMAKGEGNVSQREQVHKGMAKQDLLSR